MLINSTYFKVKQGGLSYFSCYFDHEIVADGWVLPAVIGVLYVFVGGGGIFMVDLRNDLD